MNWTPIATITVTQEWQFTPEIPLDLGYVRFKFASSVGATLLIAQTDLGTLNDLWDERQIVVTATNQIHEFLAPPFFVDRALALRVPNFTQSFEVEIEVSPMPISRSGAAQVTVQTPTSATVTPTSVAASAASQVLLAANANRKMASFTNGGTGTLYLELGATASTTAYTVVLFQNDTYELPIAYTGVVSGIWVSPNGSCVVREFT